MIQKLKKWFSADVNILLNPKTDFSDIQLILKYKFNDNSLLLQALSHRSNFVESGEQIFSNERLEFLGDAVLDLIVTEFLYKHFSNESEGSLSQKKSILVSRKALGKVSLELGLGQFLILNKGEEKTGGRNRLSNLANLFEALLGAIYLDSNIEIAAKFVKNFLIDRQQELLKTKTFFNYKSSLLEFAQARGWGAPKYSILDEIGPDHEKEFIVLARVNEVWQAQGKGLNKKSAEQEAAMNVLKIISENLNIT